MKKIIAVAAFLFCASCVSQNEAEKFDVSRAQFDSQVRIDATLDESDRISIRRIKVVQDSVAYNSDRGVYIIVDNKTGKEFIGISGVGIAETGSHSVGKFTHSDER